MKTIFWSPIHGQAGTTSNILVVSMITGMFYRKKHLLTHTHFRFNNLEAPIIGENAYNIESKEFFREVGIDPLIRSFKAARIGEETIQNCCVTLDNTNILLLPGTSKTCKESFDFEMEAVMVNLLRTLEEACDNVMVDVSAGVNSLSKKLISDADLVVINLSQNISITNTFFKTYGDLLPEKVFYLFGKYDCNSKYNIQNIRRKYHKYINNKNSGVIPYNTGFLDSQADGRVVEFIRNNLNCVRKDDNYYFTMKAKSATEKILKLAGVNTERMQKDGN